MKKVLFAALLSVLCLSVFAKGKQPIAFKALPDKVQEEVKKNLPEQQIQFITAKKELGRYQYTFLLEDNSTYVFDSKAQLRYVEDPKGVQDVFVPEKVLKYVQTTLPNTSITEYKVESGCLRATLNNKMELVFNKKGKFLRIED